MMKINICCFPGVQLAFLKTVALDDSTGVRILNKLCATAYITNQFLSNRANIH